MFSLVFAFVFFGVLVTSTIRAICIAGREIISAVLFCLVFSIFIAFCGLKREVIFHGFLSLHFSNLDKRKQKKEREREALVEI